MLAFIRPELARGGGKGDEAAEENRGIKGNANATSSTPPSASFSRSSIANGVQSATLEEREPAAVFLMKRLRELVAGGRAAGDSSHESGRITPSPVQLSTPFSSTSLSSSSPISPLNHHEGSKKSPPLFTRAQSPGFTPMLTTHEMLQSGLPHCLLAFLGPSLDDNSGGCQARQRALLQAFSSLSLPGTFSSSSPRPWSFLSGNPSPFTSLARFGRQLSNVPNTPSQEKMDGLAVLVSKLVAAVEVSEQIPVVTIPANPPSSSSSSSSSFSSRSLHRVGSVPSSLSRSDSQHAAAEAAACSQYLSHPIRFDFDFSVKVHFHSRSSCCCTG